MDNNQPAPTVRWALFGFSGRIGRKSYILGQLLMMSILAVIVARILAVRGQENATLFWGMALIIGGAISFWSTLALTVKRLHDLSLPGALVLILFVPTVNFIFAIVLMFLPSRPEVNQYGPPPFWPEIPPDPGA